MKYKAVDEGEEIDNHNALLGNTLDTIGEFKSTFFRRYPIYLWFWRKIFPASILNIRCVLKLFKANQVGYHFMTRNMDFLATMNNLGERQSTSLDMADDVMGKPDIYTHLCSEQSWFLKNRSIFPNHAFNVVWFSNRASCSNFRGFGIVGWRRRKECCDSC